MNTEGIAPIERQPIAEQVARQLLALVQSGNLKPGEQLPPERELAAKLEVSRPSLREALRALSLLGVLRIRQGGGVYVSSLDPESLLAPLHFFVSLDSRNLEDLFEARLIIESEITRIAASKISPENLAALKDCVDFEITDISDVDRFIESDVKFHQILFETVDNAFLQSFATSLHILGKARGELTASIPSVMKQSLKDHKRILRAIEARDEVAAADAMKQHVVHVRNAYRNRG